MSRDNHITRDSLPGTRHDEEFPRKGSTQNGAQIRRIYLNQSDLQISDVFSGSGALHRESQQDKGKILGFSAIWRLPSQKRSMARKIVEKHPLLLGLN